MTPKITSAERFSNGVMAAQKLMDGEFKDFPNWYVVGGAVRDTRLGVPFNDIDVFVSMGPPGGDCFVKEMFSQVRRNEYDKATDSFFEINVIKMKGDWTFHKLVERCDSGICQAGYDPKTGEFYFTPAFERDYSDNTLTITRDTRAKHIDKLVKRWPKRKLLNPLNCKLSSLEWGNYD